jgi:hypothetical protein
MKSTSSRRQAFYAIGMGAGAALLAGITAQYGTLPPWHEVAGFALAAGLLASRTIRLSPTLGTVSVGFVFVFATLVELGPLPGIMAGAVAALSGTLLCPRQRRPRPVVVLAALSSIVLSAGLAGWGHRWLDAVCSDLGAASALLSVFIVIGVYYMVNSMGVALMASAGGEQSLGQVWCDNLSWTVLPFYVGGTAVTLVHLVAVVIGPYVWLVLIPATGLVHAAMAIRASRRADRLAEERASVQ